MARHINTLQATFLGAALLMGIAIGCGDDDGGGDAPGDGGSAGDGGSPRGGGESRGGSGGRAGAPGAPGAAGEGGEPGEAGSGGGDNTPTTADVDDVIRTVCAWEFRCCDEGERVYRLSPFADTAEECAERLIFQLRQSNATANPYQSGPAAVGGILGTLGYVVDPRRVEINSAGAAECVRAWNERGCAMTAEANARCTGPATADPCALTHLFRPILEIGDECTVALTESASANDVECVAGSTCLQATDPDNPNDFPTCVKRGLQNEPCTTNRDCDFDFYCNNGRCAAKGDVGEDCSFENPDEPVAGEEDAPCKAGLTCHPLDLNCIEACTLGSTCAVGVADADAACPMGSGCAPLEVGESSEGFRVCSELGDSAASLCNSDADCVPSFYCDGSNCQADKPASAACTAQNQCAAGLHCDLVTDGTGTCVTHLAAMTACVAAYQCGPNSAGCLNAGSAGQICRNSLLPNGNACGAGAACLSGRCELATANATEMTCVPGAAEGDECDTISADGTAQSCAPGLLCFGQLAQEPGSGSCVSQAQPGLDCEDPDGTANATRCANRLACDDIWGDGAICTDGAVPAANGGTGLVCDGA